ncbi:MAG: hypothetical protein JWO56_1618 [Acidobacteria bacterium]|nr:hypothetical protein [Acidobacteriota bacterium]
MDDDDLKRLLDGHAADMRRQFVKTRRHFDVVVEQTDKKIELVAEAVISLGQELGGRIGRLEEKLDRGFAETLAMIKFSHA